MSYRGAPFFKEGDRQCSRQQPQADELDRNNDNSVPLCKLNSIFFKSCSGQHAEDDLTVSSVLQLKLALGAVLLRVV